MSASGLDPDISPDAARLQIARVAAARHSAQTEQLNSLVESDISTPQFGIFGDPRVNVLATPISARCDEVTADPLTTGRERWAKVRYQA